MRRERSDGFDKGDVALVCTSQKHSSSKKNVRNKSQDICNYYKKKVIGQKNVQKEEKKRNSRNLTRKLNLREK
jgi:hypothetical protein